MDFGNVADESYVRMAESWGRGATTDHRMDEQLFVEFTIEPLLNEKKSEEAGMLMFEDVEFITICRPGDKNDVVKHPVWMDKREKNSDWYRFRKQYEAWKSGKVEGTPLAAMAQIGILTKSDVASFLAVNVRTAEQFVAMSDADSQKYPGFSHLKQRVQAYLDRAREAAPAAALKAALEERDAKLAAISAQNAERDQEQKKLVETNLSLQDAMKDMAAQLASLQKQALARKQ